MRGQVTKSPGSFEVITDPSGVVGRVGAALLRELADRLGLTRALGWGEASGRWRHPDAAVLRDLAVMLADGGDCLSDLAVLRDQPELFGPVASTPTAWRVIERAAKAPTGWPGCGPPGRTPAPARGRLAATHRSGCWSWMRTRRCPARTRVGALWRYDDYHKTGEDRSQWNKSGLSPRARCGDDVFITVV